MRMRLATLCVVSLAISLTVESALAEQGGAQEPLDIGSRLRALRGRLPHRVDE